jgi:hypothetical protein
MKRIAGSLAIAVLTNAVCCIGITGSAWAQVGGASGSLPYRGSAVSQTGPYHVTSHEMLSGGEPWGQAQYGSGQSAHGTCSPDCVHCGHAQKPSSFWTSYYRNLRWPMPFRAQDVSAVTSFFDVQRENGWKLHNTVGHALFDPATHRLTDAGKNHIQSILTDNPIDRRAVFVLQGATPQQTAARVESTQLAISAMLPAGELPPIYLTDRDAPGSAGAYQTAITRAMMTSMPEPRLPAVSTGPSGP